MRAQGSAAPGEAHIAAGYGLKIYVEKGHLIVHQGVGRDRDSERFSRATSRLKRLVVIGHTGYVTLDALRWLQDVGAAFVQIDADSTVVARSASQWQSSARELRRAQVLAGESDLGLDLLRSQLIEKLKGQANLVPELLPFRPPLAEGRTRDPDPQGSILKQIRKLESAADLNGLRVAESSAGKIYWKVLAQLPARFDKDFTVPDHWHAAGPRTPWKGGSKRPKNALTPAHAILNYLYAILETETTIALERMGLDPSLGLMHSDKRYRPSLASDVMESVRPVADGIAIELLTDRELQRGEVFETRKGVCRLGPSLARELGGFSEDLREAVGPHAEKLVRDLLRAPDHPTPLTRQRHRAAVRVG